jgi:hypothetical protein
LLAIDVSVNEVLRAPACRAPVSWGAQRLLTHRAVCATTFGSRCLTQRICVELHILDEEKCGVYHAGS